MVTFRVLGVSGFGSQHLRHRPSSLDMSPILAPNCLVRGNQGRGKVVSPPGHRSRPRHGRGHATGGGLDLAEPGHGGVVEHGVAAAEDLAVATGPALEEDVDQAALDVVAMWTLGQCSCRFRPTHQGPGAVARWRRSST